MKKLISLVIVTNILVLGCNSQNSPDNKIDTTKAIVNDVLAEKTEPGVPKK
jgi:hypothetical protein